MPNNVDNNNLIILTGPTSVGKTALSIELAKIINGEIISADSMQVYKGMDIGTAKIKQSQMQNIPHHLIDIIDPSENYNAARFAEMATKCIKEIQERNKVPIIVGGTGFYIQAVLYGIDFSKGDESPEYRLELEQRILNGEIEEIYKELKKIDPEACDKININDHKRIIRALEFAKTSGELISEHNSKQKEQVSPYNYAYFVINDIREYIYERIDERVDEMLTEGLCEEVEHLYNNSNIKNSTALQAIGYKQIINYLEGKYDLNEAVRLIKRDTRHFAKRQVTWFKREKEVIWIDKNNFNYDNSLIINYILEQLKLHDILR